MSSTDPFELLHPSLQHHIVNTLGWSSLRPTQRDAIGPILAGEHCVLLAPTAGGKTEAAIFPVVSKMLAESWKGLSVLYICPIRALLNNLEPRLEHYLGLVGRRTGVWHGDVAPSVKNRILRDPPDLLLTTPESLEGMLISRNEDRRRLLGEVRLVVVDELHAFCGDDRGWHMRALIQRLSSSLGRDLQVVGLTATVGNPEELMNWLLMGAPARVVGSGAGTTDADLTLDYVGNIPNAAKVISRLHQGEKRLVFCDSRAKVERLAAELRGLGTRTHVSHASLSAQERRSAEAAFADESDCVIVATSTLELGIDVGDLDRVIQIDAPATVSSFLQRMGRSGRRPGTQRNYLFLATSDEGFLLAAALTRLWREGYVEPVNPPPEPWHVLAQQALAIVLNEKGVTRASLLEKLSTLFPELDAGVATTVLEYMQEQDVLVDLDGFLWIGGLGEKEFGRRHFETVVSTFTSPLAFLVVYSRQELGTVDPVSVLPNEGQLPVLVLGGRHWQAVSVDWAGRLVHVEPADAGGRTAWLGTSRALSFVACQTMKEVLIDGHVPAALSKRAEARLGELRERFDFLVPDGSASTMVKEGDFRWWTFAGAGANHALRDWAGKAGARAMGSDDFSIKLTECPCTLPIAPYEAAALGPDLAQAADQLKFSQCLPQGVQELVLSSRLLDLSSARVVASGPLTRVR